MTVEGKISVIITHPLVFARFYWLLYITWYRITEQLPCNNLRLRQYLSSDYSVENEKSQQEKDRPKSFTFLSLLLNMEDKQTRF